MSIIIGLIAIAIGVAFVIKTEWLLSNFGRIAWFEEKLGTEAAASRQVDKQQGGTINWENCRGPRCCHPAVLPLAGIRVNTEAPLDRHLRRAGGWSRQGGGQAQAVQSTTNESKVADTAAALRLISCGCLRGWSLCRPDAGRPTQQAQAQIASL